MVQRINDIEWDITNNKLINIDVKKMYIPLFLPNSFFELLSISNGGYLDYKFDYFDVDFRRVFGGGIGVIYGFTNDETERDIVENYKNPPEFFPKGLVAFGDNGGGDRTCFDYRLDPTTDNPPIVYWSCGATEGRDVSFLANNFDEFLLMLKKSD